MEHQVGSEHVDYVGKSPRDLLGDAGYDVEEDFEANNEDEVYSPRPCFRYQS